MNPPQPLPEHRIEWERLSAWRREHGAWPTPETAPEVFADELALEGFALGCVEPFASGGGLLCDTLDARSAFDLALRGIRERAARQWLWTNRERVRLAAGRLVLPADLTADERDLLGRVRAEVVKLLRDGEVTDWFVTVGQPETPPLRGPSHMTPATGGD